MRDYNILTLTLHSDYLKPSYLEDFLDALSFRMGYYDTKHTIKCLSWTESNNIPDEDNYSKNYNACYVLTDWTQQIDPDKLMYAFQDYSFNLEEQGHYDEDDNYIVDKELEDVQVEFIDNLISHIRNSNAY